MSDAIPGLTVRVATDPSRGRHLVAKIDIPHGDLVLVERPLLALQSLDNRRFNRTCHGCLANVGGPAAHFALRRRRVPTSVPPSTTAANDTAKDSAIDSDEDTSNIDYCVVPCRRGCGASYCGMRCEQDAWQAHHCYLCTGDCSSDDHPLVQFKQFCVASNEILLLVAEWWVAQHVSAARTTAAINPSTISKTTTTDTTTTTTTTFASSLAADDDSDDDDAVFRHHRYTDFVMNPWWDVLTADLQHQPGGFGEAAVLDQQLRETCATAADWFNQAMAAVATTVDDDTHQPETTLRPAKIPAISALDIACRIGACEQNAMGIRQRSPLCRDFFDVSLRRTHHVELVQCLAETGFMGGNPNDSNDENDDDNDDDEISPEQQDNVVMNDGKQNDSNEQVALSDAEEWDYSLDEIATFLSNLYMKEEYSMRQAQSSTNSSSKILSIVDDDEDETQEGDDLDVLFPPLDGTAMYALACKMNHSCNPNVILVYKRQSGWGRQHPLTAFCIALRDISEGEELTISYIDVHLSLAERQASLTNYGFECKCEKCVNEKTEDYDNMSHLEKTQKEGGESNQAENTDDSEQSDTDADGEMQLQQCLDQLDTVAIRCKFGAIYERCHNPVSAFVVQTENLLSSDDRGKLLGSTNLELLQQCALAVQDRDICMCQIVGCDLEATMLNSFNRNERQWLTAAHREAYFCSVLTACIGLVHVYNFIAARQMIDKAMELGLPFQCIADFVGYIRQWSSCMMVGPYQKSVINGQSP